MRDESTAPHRRRAFVSVEAITTAADLAGAGAITVAAWLVAVPLGLAVGGALTMFLSWMAAR